MQEQHKTKAFVGVMVLLCLGGAWISGELLKEHAGPWPSLETGAARPSLFASLCGEGPGGESACAAVLESDWGAIDVQAPVLTRELTIQRVRVVVPVAFLGLAYFVFLGVWYGFAGPPSSWGRGLRFVPLIAVGSGAICSAILLWVMVFRLEPSCLWCVVTHIINGLLLVGTLWIWPRKKVGPALRKVTQPGAAAATSESIALAPWAAVRIVGSAAFVIAGLWLYHDAKLDVRREVAKLVPYKEFVVTRQDDPAFLLREYFAEPVRIPSDAADAEGVISDTQPTVVIFSDFQCPHCACFAKQWEKDLRPQWNGPLRVSFRHFPLDPSCNNTVRQQIHPVACEASYAAEAARLQGGDAAFWQMHDQLFSHGRHLDEEPYAGLATRLGLDGDRLTADMRSDVVREIVASDVDSAARMGVHGTPRVFLNGRSVPQLCLHNPVFWDAVSSELLRRANATADQGRHAYSAELHATETLASKSRSQP